MHFSIQSQKIITFCHFLVLKKYFCSFFHWNEIYNNKKSLFRHFTSSSDNHFKNFSLENSNISINQYNLKKITRFWHFQGLKNIFVIFSPECNSYHQIEPIQVNFEYFDNYFKNSSSENGQICIFLSHHINHSILPLLGCEKMFSFFFHWNVIHNIKKNLSR